MMTLESGFGGKLRALEEIDAELGVRVPLLTVAAWEDEAGACSAATFAYEGLEDCPGLLLKMRIRGVGGVVEAWEILGSGAC